MTALAVLVAWFGVFVGSLRVSGMTDKERMSLFIMIVIAMNIGMTLKGTE